MSQMRKGTYHASYFVATIEHAAEFVRQMADGVVSSFGQDDDQWEGIDMADPGAVVTITTVPTKDSRMRYDRVRIDITVPVAEVPRGYWLSPFIPEVISTTDRARKDTHGEPFTWGMKFAPKKGKR